SSSMRKKIQNRINQRSRRARQRQRQVAPQLTSSDAQTNVISQTRHIVTTGSATTLVSAVLSHELDLKKLLDSLRILELQSQDNQAIFRAFETVANQDRQTGFLRSGMLFNLYQFNFSRSLMLNAEVLRLSARDMHDDACSGFVTSGPRPPDQSFDIHSIPAGLQPTALQRVVAHHPWVDLLPVPQLRDNIIGRDVDSYDEEGLCRAFTGRGQQGGAGVIVWREPWDAGGWELTEEFVRSWGWVFQGCSELYQSTNMWRAQRGERLLFTCQ
ncbi:hypothetical protein QQS21_012674, partial [Conoideocrella luteorostrata]